MGWLGCTVGNLEWLYYVKLKTGTYYFCRNNTPFINTRAIDYKVEKNINATDRFEIDFKF